MVSMPVAPLQYGVALALGLFPSQQRVVFTMLAHASERTANMPAANFVERVFKLKAFLVKGLNNNYRRRREGGDTASFLNAIHG